MTSQIRTKPWEVSQGKSAASTVPMSESTVPVPAMSSSPSTQSTSTTTTGTTSAATIAPSIPERPTNLMSDYNTATESPYGGYSANRGYGSSMLGGGYGSSMYGGGYGSSMYGGGYGSSMYGGGYGSSMYGGGYGSSMYGGYGSSFGGMYPSIGAGLYQVIDAINMLDQTFFALTNVAEQFRHIGNVVTSLLGIYALKDFIKKILRKLFGIKTKFNLQEFQKFQSLDNKNSNKSRFRILPILLFVGLPLLISKLISGLHKQRQEQQLAQQAQQQQSQQQLTQSPASVQFAKALYEFTPENTQIEIPLEVAEIVAILEDKSGWSRIRKRKGEMGWVPTNYLELIKRNTNV